MPIWAVHASLQRTSMGHHLPAPVRCAPIVPHPHTGMHPAFFKRASEPAPSLHMHCMQEELGASTVAWDKAPPSMKFDYSSDVLTSFNDLKQVGTHFPP